jgi:hypothetical protein
MLTYNHCSVTQMADEKLHSIKNENAFFTVCTDKYTAKFLHA